MRKVLCLAVVTTACATSTPDPYPIARLEAPIVVEVPPARTSTVSGTIELSIEGAIFEALANNRDLRIQRYGPVLAGTFEQIERGVFDPELFGRFVFSRERASQVARATGERFDVTGTNTDAEIGVRQRLPTGTTVEASASHGLDESTRTPRQQVARLGLTVTQSLLRGFGPAVNLASLDRARLELDASVHELEGYAQALVARVETAYWTLALRGAEIAIFSRSLEVAKEQQADVEQRIEVGLLPELEAAAARAEVARREQALIDAKSRLRAAELALAWIALPGSRVTIVASSPLATEPRAVDEVEAHVELALATRPEIEESKVRLEQNRLDVVVTENGVLPRLDFFVALGKTGFDTSASGSFGALGGPTYDVVAGLELSDVLGHRASKAADRAARVTYRRAEESIANLAAQVALEVRLAANEVERARAQIAATAITRSLQEKAVEAEKERFDVGTTTALIVATAQRDLLSSQIDEIRAVVDYRVALVNLYRTEGTLLARRGITLGER